jgi:hypothetical protein
LLRSVAQGKLSTWLCESPANCFISATIDRSLVLVNTKGVLDFDLMEQVAIELQHINVKLLVRDPASVDLEAAVPVFHQWIQGQVCDELLLDVADYTHVPDGPGIVLIGHEADYALDNTDGRLGIRYNRKAVLPGSNLERLEQATRSAVRAFERLQQDLKVSFNGVDCEVVINDRLLAPNTDQTRKAAEPEIKKLLAKLFDGGGYSLTYPSEPRRLFSVAVRAEREFTIPELARNLGWGVERG